MSTAVSTKLARFRRWHLAAAPGLLLVWQTSCGDSTNLRCGPGTSRTGDQCLVDAEGAGGSEGNQGPDDTGGAGNEGNTPQAGDGSGGEPSAPVGPKFAGISSTAPASDVSVQVTWEPAEDGAKPAADITYRVYVATRSGKQNFAKPSATSAPGATSHVIGNLQPDTDYYFVVRAVSADGVEDENEVELVGTPTLDDEAPEFDGVEDGTPAGAAAVELSWSPATDDQSPPEAISYVVRWSTNEESAPFGPVALQTAPGATSAVVSGLPTPS